MEVTAELEFPGDIGPQLAKLRTADKMSQSDIAPKIRVDQSRISRLEKVKWHRVLPMYEAFCKVSEPRKLLDIWRIFNNHGYFYIALLSSARSLHLYEWQRSILQNSRHFTSCMTCLGRSWLK